MTKDKVTKAQHKRIFKSLDEKYTYAAMDKDGIWYGYTHEPIKRATTWISYGYKRVGTVSNTETTIDWEKSIIKRNNNT